MWVFVFLLGRNTKGTRNIFLVNFTNVPGKMAKKEHNKWLNFNVYWHLFLIFASFKK